MTENTNQSFAPRLVLIAVGIIMLVAGLAASLLTSRQVIDYRYATVLQPPVQLPEFELIDENGDRIDRTAFQGKWNLVFFGFTHCPDVCPTTLMQLSTAVRKLHTDFGVKEDLRIVFVSVDPDRDTPEVVRPYVRYFGDNVIGLTGEASQIGVFARALGAFYQKVEMTNGEYAMDHSAGVMVIDPAGRYRALFNAPFQAELFVRDLQLLLDAGTD